MASQVAHIVYAAKYLAKYPLKSSDEFLLGVCFPDIRRIDPRIKRSDTHIIFSNLNTDLRYLEPFQAGWKFHLFCDMRREEILNRLGLYEISDVDKLWRIPNKHLEDEVIYESFKKWKRVIDLFNNPPLIKTPPYLSRETFETWYAILAEYFEKKPSSQSMKVFLSKQPNLAAYSEDIIKVVDKLRRNGKVVKLLKRVKEEIMTGI